MLLIFSIVLDLLWYLVWGKIYNELGSLCSLVKILTIIKTLIKIGLVVLLYLNDGDIKKGLDLRRMKEDLVNLVSLREDEGNPYA